MDDLFENTPETPPCDGIDPEVVTRSWAAEEIRLLEMVPNCPPALLKAFTDVFDYAMGLKDGTVIRFSEIEPLAGGKWVHVGYSKVLRGAATEFSFDRGMDVLIDSIAWVCDAPNGS